MANVKTKLDTRRPKADGTYNIIYRITHLNRVYTINSGVSILEQYWDSEHFQIIKQHPNAKLLNLKLLKGYFKIDKAILTLDDDFTIEKLRNIIKGEALKSSKSFKCFAQELIEQMVQEGGTGSALVYQTAVNRLTALYNNVIAFNEISYRLTIHCFNILPDNTYTGASRKERLVMVSVKLGNFALCNDVAFVITHELSGITYQNDGLEFCPTIKEIYDNLTLAKYADLVTVLYMPEY